MERTKAIPLVRARYVHGFAAALNRLGVPALPMLRRVGLPAEVLEHPEGFVAERQLRGLAALGAEVTGVPHFGFLAARHIEVRECGQLGFGVRSSPTLHRAIETFCQKAPTESSLADYRLAQRGDTTWFSRGPLTGRPAERQQVELFILSLMLDTVRMALGADWRPHELRLQSDDARSLAHFDLLSDIDVAFGSRVTAMAVPAAGLDMPLSYNAALGVRPVATSRMPAAMASPATDFAASLRQVLGLHLHSGTPRVALAAELAGMSVRTLQRRLGEAGLSYSEILDQTRFGAATALLRDGRVKILDIAFDLGYSDHAHFTRAFRRLAGVAPRQFRAQQAAA